MGMPMDTDFHVQRTHDLHQIISGAKTNEYVGCMPAAIFPSMKVFLANLLPRGSEVPSQSTYIQHTHLHVRGALQNNFASDF